jgi:hypothetical protein
MKINKNLFIIIIFGLSKISFAHDNSKQAFPRQVKPVKVLSVDIVNGAKIPIEKRLRHRLTRADIQTLETLGQQENFWDGWRFLAQKGDDYGTVATKVLGNPDSWIDQLYKKMVRANWVNAIGEDDFEVYFESIAKQHFQQYVSALATGFWPDSFQICLSVRKALNDHRLPADVALYGVWSKNPISFFGWETFTPLPKNRISDCSNVFRDLPSNRALLLMVNNIISFMDPNF